MRIAGLPADQFIAAVVAGVVISFFIVAAGAPHADIAPLVAPTPTPVPPPPAPTVTSGRIIIAGGGGGGLYTGDAVVAVETPTCSFSNDFSNDSTFNSTAVCVFGPMLALLPWPFNNYWFSIIMNALIFMFVYRMFFSMGRGGGDV